MRNFQISQFIVFHKGFIILFSESSNIIHRSLSKKLKFRVNKKDPHMEVQRLFFFCK